MSSSKADPRVVARAPWEAAIALAVILLAGSAAGALAFGSHEGLEEKCRLALPAGQRVAMLAADVRAFASDADVTHAHALRVRTCGIVDVQLGPSPDGRLHVSYEMPSDDAPGANVFVPRVVMADGALVIALDLELRSVRDGDELRLPRVTAHVLAPASMLARAEVDA